MKSASFLMTNLNDILNDPNEMFVDIHLSKFEEGSPEHKLLTIFSYGVWKDYLAFEKECPENLKLDINGQAVRKLRKLTLLTLFAENKNLGFDYALEQLSMDSIVEMEGLVIDLLSEDLVDVKIDEKSSTIYCTRVSSRCVKKEDVPKVLDSIKAFREKISKALEEVV